MGGASRPAPWTGIDEVAEGVAGVEMAAGIGDCGGISLPWLVSLCCCGEAGTIRAPAGLLAIPWEAGENAA